MKNWKSVYFHEPFREKTTFKEKVKNQQFFLVKNTKNLVVLLVIFRISPCGQKRLEKIDFQFIIRINDSGSRCTPNMLPIRDCKGFFEDPEPRGSPANFNLRNPGVFILEIFATFGVLHFTLGNPEVID